MEFKIHGLESHAGVAHEEGISAIKIAAEGLAAMSSAASIRRRLRILD